MTTSTLSSPPTMLDIVKMKAGINAKIESTRNTVFFISLITTALLLGAYLMTFGTQSTAPADGYLHFIESAQITASTFIFFIILCTIGHICFIAPQQKKHNSFNPASQEDQATINFIVSTTDHTEITEYLKGVKTQGRALLHFEYDLLIQKAIDTAT